MYPCSIDNWKWITWRRDKLFHCWNWTATEENGSSHVLCFALVLLSGSTIWGVEEWACLNHSWKWPWTAFVTGIPALVIDLSSNPLFLSPKANLWGRSSDSHDVNVKWLVEPLTLQWDIIFPSSELLRIWEMSDTLGITTAPPKKKKQLLAQLLKLSMLQISNTNLEGSNFRSQ